MLCEECHVNEANFTVSVVTGEETTVRHLCADCMSKMNSDLMKGNVRSLLSTVLNAIQATAGNETRKEFSMPIFGRFTQKAQQTLLLAQKIAADLQQPYVGTEHLLLSLLKSGVPVDQAFKVIHFDEINAGVAASTAKVGKPRCPRSRYTARHSHTAIMVRRIRCPGNGSLLVVFISHLLQFVKYTPEPDRKQAFSRWKTLMFSAECV